MGALNSKVHLEKLQKYAKIARKEGGVIECGFGKTDLKLAPELQNGYYFPPTVVTGLSNDSRYEII